MSINYYMRRENVDSDDVIRFGVHIEFSGKDREAGYVHLCKVSCGWPPLMEGNAVMRSVSDMRSFLAANPEWSIVDEYEDSCTPEEFFDLVRKRRDAALREDRNRHDAEGYWTDAEGYDFTDHVFL